MFFLFYAVLGCAAKVRFCKIQWLEDLNTFQNTLNSEIGSILNSHTLIKVIRMRKTAKVANFNWTRFIKVKLKLIPQVVGAYIPTLIV